MTIQRKLLVNKIIRPLSYVVKFTTLNNKLKKPLFGPRVWTFITVFNDFSSDFLKTVTVVRTNVKRRR